MRVHLYTTIYGYCIMQHPTNGYLIKIPRKVLQRGLKRIASGIMIDALMSDDQALRGVLNALVMKELCSITWFYEPDIGDWYRMTRIILRRPGTKGEHIFINTKPAI